MNEADVFAIDAADVDMDSFGEYDCVRSMRSRPTGSRRWTSRTHHRDPKKRRSPRTVTLYRQRMHAHVLPTLGTYPIDELTVADLRRLIEKLGAKFAPSTVTANIVMLSSLLRYAVRQRLVERNVARDLDRDDRPGAGRQTEPRYLSAEEVTPLLPKMSDTFRPVAASCAYAGLRISEALGLTWADVDFNAKQIHVRRQLDGDGTIRNVTKTKASKADVPLLPTLERELREQCSRQAGINTSPDRARPRTRDPHPQTRTPRRPHQRIQGNRRTTLTEFSNPTRSSKRPENDVKRSGIVFS